MKMAVHNNTSAGPQPFIAPQNPSDKEKQDVLICLPRGTREYEFQGIKNAEEILDRERRNGSLLVLFSHVSPHIKDRISKERQLSRKIHSYYPESKLLLFKMPQAPHEIANRRLEGLLVTKLIAMGAHQYLDVLGSTTVQGTNREKEPDSSYRPKTLPLGRTMKWPTMVFEIGYSESRMQLARDARWWLNDSQGDVQVVLTIDVERARREIIIERWEAVRSHTTRSNPTGLRLEVVQSVKISRLSSQTSATVTNGPLVVPFRRLFLRPPALQEGDISFTVGELQGLAENVWASQGL